MKITFFSNKQQQFLFLTFIPCCRCDVLISTINRLLGPVGVKPQISDGGFVTGTLPYVCGRGPRRS